MKKNVWTALGIVLVVLFAAVAVVSQVKGACAGMIECASGQVPMKCHWAYIATTVTGIGGALIALLAAFSKTCEGRRMVSLAAVIVAVIAIVMLAPTGIGTCAHAESVCNSNAVVVYVLCVAAIIVGLVMAAKADPQAAEKPKMQL